MRKTAILFALASVALGTIGAAGCGDDESAGSGGDATGGATDGATTDATSTGTGEPIECARGSHEEAGACTSSLVEWTTAPSLAQKRDHHATAIALSDAGPMLYVIGGVVDNTEDLASVEIAPIQSDGSLGAFHDGGALPETAAGAAIAVVGRTVLVIGGFRSRGGFHLSSQTDVAQLGADGALGEWTEGPEMSTTRFRGAAVAKGSNVYVVGGLMGNNTNNTERVERAVVGADGVVGAWERMPDLPEKRSHHGLVEAQGGLWVTGGLTGDPAGTHTDFDDVLFAPILEDGSLGEWAEVGTLPNVLVTHSSFVVGDYLYVAGGVHETHNTDEVWRASIAGGVLGAWEAMPPLPTPRAHAHQTPFFDGFVYAPGGAYNHASIADVFVGRFE